MQILTPEHFPAPARINTFAIGHTLTPGESAELVQRQAFAAWQADEANAELAKLRAADNVPTAEDWTDLYESVAKWRYSLGVGWSDLGVRQTSHNQLTPITDDNPNRDIFGDLGRMRVGDKFWDEATSTWKNGLCTPAGLAIMATAERIRERFREQPGTGDTIQNTVVLPDGMAVYGNRLLKGLAAKEVMLALKKTISRRIPHTPQFEIRDDFVVSETATQINRTFIFRAVMKELERLSRDPGDCTPRTKARLSNLLLLAPKYKRGSAASIPVFAAIFGTYITERAGAENTELPFVLPPDADLRAVSMSQDAFLGYTLAYQEQGR